MSNHWLLQPGEYKSLSVLSAFNINLVSRRIKLNVAQRTDEKLIYKTLIYSLKFIYFYQTFFFNNIL